MDAMAHVVIDLRGAAIRSDNRSGLQVIAYRSRHAASQA